MKKVVVITQHIFPIQTPRSLRSTELVQELGKRGYDVTVYAVIGDYDYSSFEVQYNVKVEPINIKWQITPYTSDGIQKRSFIDKVLFRLLGKKTLFPDIELYFRVKEIAKKEEDADVLISIANPHTIHWGLGKAKRDLNKFPKVWIADCGDPFMKNNKSDKPAYFEKLERTFCEQADFIAVPFDDAIDAYYPEYRDKVKTISQGFEFDLDSVFPAPVKQDFSNHVPKLIYAGVFLPGIREPYELLDALEKTDKKFEFHIYTPYRDLVHKYQDKMKGKLFLQDIVSRDELLGIIKTFDIVVNVENNLTTTQLPSKLIDYAISGKPILSIKNGNYQKNENKINDFLDGNFKDQLVIDRVESYHIKNVVNLFEELF